MQASLDSKLLILASQSHLYIFSRGSASSNIHFPICSYIFPIPRPSNCCISISSSSVSASVHCRPRLQTFIARLTAIKSTVDSWRNNCRAKGQLDAVLRCETSMEKDGKGGVSFGDFGRCGDFGYSIGSMYAIYGNMYHQYTPVMLAYIYIYTSTMDPSWVWLQTCWNQRSWIMESETTSWQPFLFFKWWVNAEKELLKQAWQ